MAMPQLQTALAELGLKKYRAKQIFDWLYRKCVFDFAQMSNIGKAERELLQEKFSVLPAEVNIVRKLDSSDGLTRKLLLELPDGNAVETVLMHHDYGYSVCVSSQAGCDMHCAFCASGLNGAIRNLSVAEILAQVYVFNQELVSREEHPAPKVWLNPDIKNFYDFTTADLHVENFVTGEQIKGIPIAV